MYYIAKKRVHTVEYGDDEISVGNVYGSIFVSLIEKHSLWVYCRFWGFLRYEIEYYCSIGNYIKLISNNVQVLQYKYK